MGVGPAKGTRVGRADGGVPHSLALLTLLPNLLYYFHSNFILGELTGHSFDNSY
jgi:hypothetical protein